MKDFIDRTADQAGTPINRANMMAAQDFISNTTTFDTATGKITETNELGEKLVTTFNSDGSITETFTGDKVITKTTTFQSSGNIVERVV